MNSQEKQFLDAEVVLGGSNNTTSNSMAYTYIAGTDGTFTGSNTNYLTGSNTNYLISIPDGEITFEELSRAMKTLSNAVVHMQSKMAVMESVEKPKCKPRKLGI